jgi:hypothetical protein
MSIEHEAGAALKLYSRTIEIDPELDTIVLASFTSQFQAKRYSLRKALITIGIAGLVVLPTAAFMMPSLADQIYGSFSVMKKKFAAATMEQYTAVGMKLSGAQKELGADYPAFISLVKRIATAKVEYGDSYGNIDFTNLPANKHSELRQVYYEVQPYWDRLNHLKSSKTFLSETEYDQYIDALILRESVLVKAGIDPSKGPVDPFSLPRELKPDFDKADHIIRQVSGKQ